LKAALGRKGASPNELADLQFFTAFCHCSVCVGQEKMGTNFQEAIGLYEQAARVYEVVNQNKFAITQYNLGLLYSVFSTGDRAANLLKAVAAFGEAIRLNPKNANAYAHRGNAYLDQGDYDKAIADYNKAIRLDPNNAEAYKNRGFDYQAKGDYGKAIADYNEAIRLDPNNANAYYNRGAFYSLVRGDYEKAIADYNETIWLDPKEWHAYNALAWLLGTCIQANFRNGKKAVEYATKACELSEWKRPSSLDMLAAAYAETGDFNQAIKWETKYLETPGLSEKETTNGKSRLALYQARQPYYTENGM